VTEQRGWRQRPLARDSKVRLISHRSYGLHGPAPLIALIYLCCGGIHPVLPLK
jgi:hypothetical protein